MFDLIKYRTIFLLFNFLLNPSAPKCLKNGFQLLSISREPLGHLTRASLYDLKVRYPHSNSGKRTLAYSASKHFNDLNSEHREYFTASSPQTSRSLNSILSSIKCKLGNLFLSRPLNIWKIYCFWIAAILFIVIGFHSTIHSSICELFPYDLHIHFTRFSKYS